MFEFKPLSKQIIEERNKNKELQAKLSQKEADIEYIAMMCDVELGTEVSEDE